MFTHSSFAFCKLCWNVVTAAAGTQDSSLMEALYQRFSHPPATTVPAAAAAAARLPSKLGFTSEKQNTK